MAVPIIAKFLIAGAVVAVPRVWRHVTGKGHGTTSREFGSSDRRGEVFAWAAINRWQYEAQAEFIPGMWRDPPFGMGSGRRATEVVTGVFEQRPSVSFTYSWTDDRRGQATLLTGALGGLGGLSGVRRHTPLPQSLGSHKHVHVIAMQLPGWLPTVEFIPRNIADQFVLRSDRRTVRTESAAFNDAWRVDATNTAFAHKLLHPRFIQRMLLPDAIGQRFRFENDTVVWLKDGLSEAGNITPALILLSSAINSVPDFIWQDFGRR